MHRLAAVVVGSLLALAGAHAAGVVGPPPTDSRLAGPPAPFSPTGHLELYAAAAVSPGQRTDARVEPQGCSPAPRRYEWSLSSNARPVAVADPPAGGGSATLSVVFLGPDSNRGRFLGAVDVRALDGPCAGMTAHASVLVGTLDPTQYDPALDDDRDAATLPAPAAGLPVAPPPAACAWVPPQRLYFDPQVQSTGRLEVLVLTGGVGCPPK